MKKVRIIVAGSGGQGILTLGSIISYAAIYQGLDVSCLPSYGAEMRGGYVYCAIVLSSGKHISSPVSSEADIGVFMNDRSLKMLEGYLKKNASVILNTSLIRGCSLPGFNIIERPVSEMAEEMGDMRYANMIAAGLLGNLLDRQFGGFDREGLHYGMKQVIRGTTLVAANKKALNAGWILYGKNGRNNKKRVGKSQ